MKIIFKDTNSNVIIDKHVEKEDFEANYIYFDLSKDIMISSAAKVEIEGHDFEIVSIMSTMADDNNNKVRIRLQKCPRINCDINCLNF